MHSAITMQAIIWLMTLQYEEVITNFKFSFLTHSEVNVSFSTTYHQH